ncbi:MAG: ABC transporter permease [Chloroflexi bacterium]|nr:ABC transporter permease [Chloroflexota bacterium]
MRLASLVRFSSQVAWRRTLADWRLQMAAAFGVVLAATLLAAGVIYSHALEETALHYSMDKATQEDVNLTVRVFHALERPVFRSTERFIQSRVQEPLRPFLKGTVFLVQTSTMYFSGLPQGEGTEAERPRGALQAITDLHQRARLVEGRFPASVAGEVEFVTDAQGVALLGLSLGQTFQVFSAIGGDPTQTVQVRLVGVIAPLEPEDQYWHIGIRHRASQSGQPWISVPMYTELDALFKEVGTVMPALHTDFVWLLVMDQPELRASQAGLLRQVMQGVIEDVQANLEGSAWNTRLVEILDRHAALLVVARVPLFLVLFLAVGVLLYYLFLIAGFLGRLRAQEVALIRSRGASLWQAGVVIFLEGLIMAVPATLLGPLLAQLLVSVTGTLFPVTTEGSGLERVGLSRDAFLLAGAGAFLAAVVFTLSTLSAARKGMVSFRSTVARPPEQPLFLRYYLDAALLALLTMVWWQLRSRGTFLIRPVGDSSLSLDVALLLGPVVGVLAVGLVIIRLFPLLMRLVGKIAEPFGPPWLVQALRRLGRDPVPSAALLVLVVLATSLGVLSSTVIATLERSQQEQGLYEAGADFRVYNYLGERVAAGHALAEGVALLPGVAAAAEVMRLETKVYTESLGDDVAILAVDTRRFSSVSWNREDLTRGPLAEALGPITPESPPPGGILLPQDATALGIWVYPGRLGRQPSLFARLQDGVGRYFDVRLGQLSDQQWTYLEAPISPYFSNPQRAPSFTVGPPYTLHTLWAGSAPGVYTSGVLFIDLLQAVTPRGVMEVESFQDVDGWYALEDPLANGLYSLESSETVTRPGRKSALFIWGRGGLSLRGIRAGPPEEPIPALVSETFLDTALAKMDDTMYAFVAGVQAPVKIVGVLPYFPSLNPRPLPFMVVDLSYLMRYVALHNAQPQYPGIETWVRAEGDGPSGGAMLASAKALGDPLARLEVGSTIVSERVSHPLLAAGWSGLLALSFLSVVLASASGLLLYTYIDAREQVGQMAVMRTLGFTRLQVNGLVWFNLALTLFLGAMLGALGGRLLAAAILPLLAVAEGGAQVTPPMVVQSDWDTLLMAYLVLAVAMVITVLALARAIARLDVQRLLRVAEA